MSRSVSIERFPLWLRDGERGTADVYDLIVERFGTYEQIKHERPLTPAERRARGT